MGLEPVAGKAQLPRGSGHLGTVFSWVSLETDWLEAPREC